ncbi:hypothetical protein RFI_11824 [Reticulomyxa filosa]|uniref:Transmembrane 9 superfamily member n=1 Tax=Reticulomyxa filosa TaxID=46433 RepID=X6NH60_RETFI|nr:hypothetical protein RFI_11824 [Reticulomyxa filosa]|eukprot:ETO25316.1 hypothetical protein RFI_11824 [Reticulomyxa filosa]
MFCIVKKEQSNFFSLLNYSHSTKSSIDNHKLQKMRVTLLLLLFNALLYGSSGFYLPGVAPHEYQVGEAIKLKVNKLDSVFTQMPYDYYSLPFCRPSEGIKQDAENLGELLSGDKIENSPFKLAMNKPVECQVLCMKTYNKKDLFHFQQKIEERYRVNFIVDNFPAAQKFRTIISEEKKENDYIYEKGYPLGSVIHHVGFFVVVLCIAAIK